MTPNDIEDLKRIAKTDPRYIIESYFWIESKEKKIVPFVFNQVQDKYYKTRTNKDDILKARQEGFSSLILGLFTVEFLFVPNSRCVCISHEKQATQRLLNKVKFFIQSLESDNRTRFLADWVDLKYQSKYELYFPKMNSWFYVGTAGSKAFGRGDTIHNLHCSEVSRWPHAKELMTGLLQAVPKSGRIVKETTANGMGNYHHQMWLSAIEGEGPFKSHFFGWHEHDEYVLTPPSNMDISPKELKLMETYGLSKQQVAWRQAKRREFPNEDEFKQEYPINWREAFIASGNPVFDMNALQWYREHQVRDPDVVGNIVGQKPRAIEQTPNGYLKIYRRPLTGRQYVIGADPSGGGDNPACAQVLDRSNMEQVAVWHGRIDPDNFGRELNQLGHYYNGATLGVERNNEGIATLMVLRELYYPSVWMRERVERIEHTDPSTKELGWLTNSKTKPLMIGDGQQAIRDKGITLYDGDTIRELEAFVYDDSGKASGQAGTNDDRVMALLIAIQMYNRVPLDDRAGNPLTSGDSVDQNELMRPGGGVVEEFFR